MGEVKRNEEVLDDAQFATLALQLLSDGKTIRFRAHGSSMAPTIIDTDVIEVEPAHSTALKRGDIVLAHTTSSTTALHRLVEIRSTSQKKLFILRGDAINDVVESVDEKSILGRATHLTRGTTRYNLNRGLGPWWSRTTARIQILRRLQKKCRKHPPTDQPNSV